MEREGEFTTLEAVSLALELYPDSAVVEIERDHEKGGEVWEIVIRHQDARGTELHIDVQTGDVLKERPARVPSEVRAAPPRISIEEAIAIALETVPGAISEMEIETQGGRVVWEAEGASSSGRMFVHIDAHSGEVIAQGVGN
ncbi:MAG: PepSY domain-containing protein [Coriobacteriia bacterium]|nr:PepSY domain-containing protein [Coriobacteriia bacterium]